jgi:hypothetical protein
MSASGNFILSVSSGDRDYSTSCGDFISIGYVVDTQVVQAKHSVPATRGQEISMRRIPRNTFYSADMAVQNGKQLLCLYRGYSGTFISGCRSDKSVVCIPFDVKDTIVMGFESYPCRFLIQVSIDHHRIDVIETYHNPILSAWSYRECGRILAPWQWQEGVRHRVLPLHENSVEILVSKGKTCHWSMHRRKGV